MSKSNFDSAINKNKTDNSKTNLIDGFGKSLINSSVLNPVDAINQLVNKVAGTKLPDDLAYKLDPAKFNSKMYYAQTAGMAIGSILPLYITSKLIPIEAKGELLASTSDLAQLDKTAALGFSLKQAAVSGFVYGSVLTPDKSSNISLSQMLKERSIEGLSSSLMFTSMTASSLALSKIANLDNVQSTIFGNILNHNIANSTLSAIPASVVSTETDSLIFNRQFASSQSLAQNAYTMSLMGLGFGAINDIQSINLGGKSSNQEKLNYAQSIRPPVDPSIGDLDISHINAHRALESTELNLDKPTLPDDTEYEKFNNYPLAYIDGRPLLFYDNRAKITDISHDRVSDVLDNMVSQNHGSITFSPLHDKFIYTDTSDYGTYIRDGNWHWQYLTRGQSAIVSKDDEIFLGSKTGPKVNLDILEAKKYADGTHVYTGENYFIIHRPDGNIERINDDGTGYVSDKSGKTIQAFGPNSFTIDYKYNSLAKLISCDVNYFGQYSMHFESRNGKDFMGSLIKKGSFLKPQSQPVEGELSVAKDGSLIIKAKSGIKTIYHTDGSQENLYPNGYRLVTNANSEAETTRFEDLINSRFGDTRQKNRISDLMNTFNEEASKNGISKNDRAVFMHYVNDIMAHSSSAYLPLGIRARLAEQILFNASYPKLIDQGFNKTCNVSTLETRMYIKSPKDAARLIREAAIYGKSIALNGKIINFARSGALVPDNESMTIMQKGFEEHLKNPYSDIKKDGIRNYANQIFQNAAVNAFYTYHTLPNVAANDVIEYSKVQSTDPTDTGERLKHYSISYYENKPRITVKTLEKAPNIDNDKLVDLYNYLVPKIGYNSIATKGNDQGFIVVGPHEKDSIINSIKSGKVSYTDSQEHFTDFLKYAKSQKMFPLILLVKTDQSPELFGERESKMHQLHVILAHDIRQQADGSYKIDITNQWGSKYNFLGLKAAKIESVFKSLY